ncbi:hypothetical protein R1flu_019755 [Riccia fluitans]|uniref:Uncharacterized protein n=1 Tax=Riccia fluitans TaxID=41844 RepID=A0ABD1ZJY9_9MARC
MLHPHETRNNSCTDLNSWYPFYTMKLKSNCPTAKTAVLRDLVLASRVSKANEQPWMSQPSMFLPARNHSQAKVKHNEKTNVRKTQQEWHVEVLPNVSAIEPPQRLKSDGL